MLNLASIVVLNLPNSPRIPCGITLEIFTITQTRATYGSPISQKEHLAHGCRCNYDKLNLAENVGYEWSCIDPPDSDNNALVTTP